MSDVYGKIYKHKKYGIILKAESIVGDLIEGVVLMDVSRPNKVGRVVLFSEENYVEVDADVAQLPGVDKVIFNDKTVIVYTDGSKGVSTCSEDDYYDPFVGFCVAYANAKFFNNGDRNTPGNKSKLKQLIHKLKER